MAGGTYFLAQAQHLDEVARRLTADSFGTAHTAVKPYLQVALAQVNDTKAMAASFGAFDCGGQPQGSFRKLVLATLGISASNGGSWITKSDASEIK